MLTRHRLSAECSKISRRGAAAVEFAVLSFFFCWIILGMLEIGTVFTLKEAMTDAARTGCRTGCQMGNTNVDVTNNVNRVLSANNLASADATITILVNGTSADVSTQKKGDKITVNVSIPLDKVYQNFGFFHPTSVTINSQPVTMLSQINN